MAGTIVVDRIESDGSYASTINVASKVNFTGGMQIGGQDTTFAGMRNRIINGDMTVCQRYAPGTTVSSNTGIFFVDRWRSSVDGPSANVTFEQSTDAPAGFKNSLSCTILTANTPTSTSAFTVVQPIEGQNIVDFKQGTADAVPMSLSFWVKSSITGTYAISIRNSSAAKTLVKTYTINQANTWEYKALVIPPETSGTWNKDNTSGCFINFVLGVGSNYIAPATDTWYNSIYSAVSGCVNLVSTAGAVFKFTGVQFEKGSVATPFEQRMYAQELNLCHRYFYSTEGVTPYIGHVYYDGSGYCVSTYPFPQVMRSSPSIAMSNGHINIVGDVTFSDIGSCNRSIKFFQASTSSGNAGYPVRADFTASSEL